MPTEQEWEAHKSIINGLYMVLNVKLQGPGGVMEQMSQLGFHAKKSQYERYIEKWGFSKYQSKQTWISIAKKVNERQRAGKDSEVYINEVVVPPRKLKKEIQRYRSNGRSDFNQEYYVVQLPPVVRIKTPNPASSTIASSNVQQQEIIQLSTSGITWTSSLPILSFASKFEKQRTPSPFCPLGSGAQRQFLNDNLLRTWMSTIKFDTLMSTLPPELVTGQLALETTQDLICLGTNDLLIRVALYLISNNLIPHDHDSASGIITWFEAQDVQQFQGTIQFLVSQNDTTSVATLENLLDYSILANNVMFTKKLIAISKSNLISQGRDRGYWVLSPGRLRMKLNEALKESCVCQNFELAKGWINLGASAARISLSSVFGDIERRAIAKASSQPLGRLRIGLDWARMLLESGAMVCDGSNADQHGFSGCLKWASRLDDQELVSLLIEDPWGTRYCQQCIEFVFFGYHTDGLPSKQILELWLKKYRQRRLNGLTLAIALKLESLEAIEYCLSPQVKASSPSWSNNMKTLLTALGQYRGIRCQNPDFGSLDIASDHSLPLPNWRTSCLNAEPTVQNASSIRHPSNLEMLILETLQLLPSKLQSPVLDHCLNVAVEYDSPTFAMELLGRGATISIKALQLSVERGSAEMISMVLKPSIFHFLSIDDRERMKKVWMAAFQHSDVSILKALYDAGLQLTFCPYHLVLEEKSHILTLLNDFGLTVPLQPALGHANPHSEISLLEAAIRANNVALIDRLLPSVADNGDEGAMRAAVYLGINMVEKLLSANAMFSPYRNLNYLLPALHLAIRRRDSAIIQRLLQTNAPVDKVFDNANGRRRGYFQNEVERSVYKSCLRKTALESAINADREPGLPILTPVLLCLGDFNATIPSRDGTLATPLILAIRHRNYLAVDMLLNLGATADLPTTHLLIYTPLQAAVTAGDRILIEKLLDLKVNVNALSKNFETYTALQISAARGFVPIACMLLGAGAEVNAPGSLRGGTAIEQAAKYGRIDMIQLLVQYGAQLVGPGFAQFKRAKQLATDNGHHAACRLLESLHAEQVSTFTVGAGDIMLMPSGEFLASEDQGGRPEHQNMGQNGALADLGWINLPQKDILVNGGTFNEEIIASADVGMLTELNSYTGF